MNIPLGFASSVNYPIYVGILAGYGSTNWNSLANHDKDYSDQVLTTVPEKADDTGLDYGAFIGYQFTPNYALEFEYRKFKTSDIFFNYPDSIYVDPAGNRIYDFRSTTFNIALVNKLILPLPNNFSVFSGLGPSMTYRRDELAKRTQEAGVTFVVGANYDVNERVILGIEGDYSSGWGKSEYYPVYHYIPFLYSANLKLAYRFDPSF